MEGAIYKYSVHRYYEGQLTTFSEIDVEDTVETPEVRVTEAAKKVHLENQLHTPFYNFFFLNKALRVDSLFKPLFTHIHLLADHLINLEIKWRSTDHKHLIGFSY